MYVHILTRRYRRHKKMDGYHFCNAFTTTAVMEVWTCLLSMWYYYVTRHRTQKASRTHAHKRWASVLVLDSYEWILWFRNTQQQILYSICRLHTYPYTSRYRPHKKREGSPFCNNAYTTTAVMEVLTCLLSMCYLLLCHRTQKANWTRAHKS